MSSFRDIKRPINGAPDQIRTLGAKIYRSTITIAEPQGADSYGGKIRCRGTAGGEIGPLAGEDGEDWKSVSAMGWFLATKVYLAPHILISPFAVYGIATRTNKAQGDNEMKLRSVVSGNAERYATTNVTKQTIARLMGNAGVVAIPREMGRIRNEIP